MLSTNLQALKEKARRFFLPAEAVHIFQMIMTSSLFLAVLPTTAMAGPDEMFGKLIGLVLKIFFYIGSILLVWAIGQLVLAFKNEDADSKSRAVMVLAVAILLMSVKQIYESVTSDLSGNKISAGDIEL